MPLSKIDQNIKKNLRDRTLMQHCIAGMGFWGLLTDTVIVTTTVERATSLYTDLAFLKPPHVSVIGGVKTYIVSGARSADKRPYNFADMAAWRRIANAVAVVAKATGNNPVILENETALTPFHSGKGGVDLKALGSALAPLRETGVTIWWYLPTILVNNRKMPDRRAQTAELVKAVFAAVPNSLFLTPYTNHPDWKQDSSAVSRRQEMIRIVGVDRLVEMLQVRPDGYVRPRPGKKIRCLAPKEVRGHIDQLPGDSFVIYTGAIKWVDMARRFAELHSERSGSAKGADDADRGLP